MANASSVILYNCKINHNGLFGCDFGGNGATRDSVMGSTNGLATVKFSMSNCTFIRKDKVIVVDQNADVLDAAGVNYCRFINSDFDNSLYIYAFVDRIEYVAPQTSRLHIRTDCFMTYFHRINPNQCFVEREHVASDKPYEHSVPENLGTGELRRDSSIRLLYGEAQTRSANFYGHWWAAFNVAADNEQLEDAGLSGSFDNWMSGGCLCGTNWFVVQLDQVKVFAQYLVSKGIEILTITVIPKLNFATSGRVLINYEGIDMDIQHLDNDSSNNTEITIQPQWSNGHFVVNQNARYTINNIWISLGSFISGFDGDYHNRKLLCYPYMGFELFTYDGSSNILIPQDSVWDYGGNGSFGMRIWDWINCGAIPTETAYLGWDTGSVDGVEGDSRAYISFASFPTMQVSKDAYDSYIARNQNSLKFQKNVAQREKAWKIANNVASTGKELVGDFMSKNILGGAADLAEGVHDIIEAGDQVDAIEAKMADLKSAPDGTVGQPSEDSLFRTNRMGIYFGVRKQNPQVLRCADSFFDRYGYQVNTTKTPQWNSRPRFNYIKTAGACISGEIPASDKDTINKLLDTGLTVWHSAAYYGDYDGANNLAPVRA